MCFFYSIRAKSKAIAKRYDKHTQLEIDFGQRKIAAGYDHPEMPIIIAEDEVQYMQWGLIPTYVRPKSDSQADREKAFEQAMTVRKRLYNARSETIFETFSYRNLIYTNRCLIPSTGYFEFHHNSGGGTTPFILFLKNLGIFSMAGLFNVWKNPMEDELIPTFTMITVPGNSLTNSIHNGGKNPFRMPLIIPKDDESHWLDPNLRRDQIEALMRPYDENDMDTEEVDKDFKSKP